MPYGCSVGSCWNSTPRADSSSYVAWTSSEEKKRPLAAPLAMRATICSRVSSSNTGGPGTAMSVTATSGWPGTPTLSQRKLPISGTVTSSRSSRPSFSV
jgi:hypothetical protein